MTKSSFWLRLMRIYVRHRAQRMFSDVLIRNLSTLKLALDRGPVLLAANHVCWWDPLIVILLDEALGSDGYALMAESSLKELTWFARLGAIPISQTSPKRALTQLSHAASLLDVRRRFLLVFPSGRQIPSHLPLEFRSGVVHLEKATGAPLFPIALRYAFGESPQPKVWLSVGPELSPTPQDAKSRLGLLEQAVRTELRHIDQQLDVWSRSPQASLDAEYTSLLHPLPKRAREGRIPFLARLLGTERTERTEQQAMPAPAQQRASREGSDLL